MVLTPSYSGLTFPQLCSLKKWQIMAKWLLLPILIQTPSMVFGMQARLGSFPWMWQKLLSFWSYPLFQRWQEYLRYLHQVRRASSFCTSTFWVVRAFLKRIFVSILSLCSFWVKGLLYQGYLTFYTLGEHFAVTVYLKDSLVEPLSKPCMQNHFQSSRAS